MERERPRELRVDASPVRCPFCHADVAVDAEAWVACEKCLARHHRSCWDESARCATCGGGTALARERAPDPVVALERALATTGSTLRLVATGEAALAAPARAAWTVEASRVLPFGVAPALRGVFRSAHPFVRSGKRDRASPLALEVTGDATSTTVRARLDLREIALGLHGGIGGGLGLGGAGGCAYPAWLLGGPLGVVLCAAFFITVAFVLSTTILAAVRRFQRARLDALLDAVGRELPRPVPPRPAPPKDAA